MSTLMLPALRCALPPPVSTSCDSGPFVLNLPHQSSPAPLISPLWHQSEVHTCFSSSPEPAASDWLLLGPPDRPKEPERLGGAAPAAQLLLGSGVNWPGSRCPHAPAEPGTEYFWKGWPGSPSHTLYLLSEIIINNKYLGHRDHPWWPTPVPGSYL